MSKAQELADRLEMAATNGDMGRKPDPKDHRRKAADELRRLERVKAELVELHKRNAKLMVEIAQELNSPRLPLQTVVQTSVRLLAETVQETSAALSSSGGNES